MEREEGMDSAEQLAELGNQSTLIRQHSPEEVDAYTECLAALGVALSGQTDA